MQGFFTPTEAGSVGTFAVILLTLFQREMSVGAYIKAVSGTLRIACMVSDSHSGRNHSRPLLRRHAERRTWLPNGSPTSRSTEA